MKNLSLKVFFLFCFGVSFGSDIEALYLPTDNFDTYQLVDISKDSPYGITSLKPYSCEKVQVFLGYSPEYCKRVELFKSVKSDTFYNSKESAVSIILEKEGIRLKEGLNLISTLEGSFSLSGKINLQYQLRNYFNQEENKLSVHRAFVTFNFEKLFLFIGKDNIKVGPSRYGNLLSSTNPPFYQARIQSKRPLEFFGLLDFTVMYGKFLEDRKDHSDPSLFFIRGDYKPNRYLEIGINRAVLFGGEGRSSYRIKEYPRVFIGREETLGGRFDNDSYLGYDVRLNLFFDKLDIFQVYYENNATDIESPLKKGDPKKLHFPLVLFKFHDNAQTLGVKVKRGRYLLNWELTNTGKTMYINHNYPVEGLSYKSFVLGYPYGRSVTHTFLLLSILDKEVDNHLEVGFIKQPTDITLPDRFKDYYITYRINLKRGKFEISPYIRVDFTENLNYSTLPTQFYIKQGSTTIYTGGMSIGYLF